jgi:general secretion pathway protein K
MRSLTPLGVKIQYAGKAEAMRDRSEDGIALIAVLWMLTLLSIVAAALSLETQSNTRIARNMVENAAERAAADAGVQRAILDLVASPGAPKDTGKFRADGTVYTWRFANSTVHISVQDERGKIDLNETPEALLAALFGSVGVDPGKAQSLADAIADFRDADNLPRLNGAEEADYRAAGFAWGPKNAPFQTVEELQQVFGITPEIYARVAPYLTIYSMGVINPALVGERLTGSLRPAGFDSQILASSPGLAFSIRAETKGSNGAMFVREAVVQLDSQETVPVHILAWRQGVPTSARNAWAAMPATDK